ncbi:MAG: hypothetical protein ACE5DZ_08050 [Mariprofundus sp.]
MPRKFHPKLLQQAFKCLLLAVMLSASSQVFAAAIDEVKHFPEAAAGMKQVVILLPARQQDEKNFKVVKNR